MLATSHALHTTHCIAGGGSSERPPKPLKQACLKPKLALAEIPTDHAAVTAEAVEPELTQKNAGSRFVYVPASYFNSEGIGGWIAKCAPDPPTQSLACA